MNLNVRSILLVLVALGVAGTTAFLARGWLSTGQVASGPEAPAYRPPVGLEILVAKGNLPTGTLIQKEHLRWQAWPDDSVADSYVRRADGKLEAFLGAVVRQGVSAGEPITDTRVVKPGEQGFMAAVLPPGMRAITVAVSATSGIAGFVFPGDRVDLILSHKIRMSRDEVRLASETVLSNVRVLAIDQKTDDQSNAPALAKTATLEVTPKQAEKINVARQLGGLSLSLRPLQLAEKSQSNTEIAIDPKPTSGASHTWDSEVSRLLPPAKGRDGNEQKVNLVRGDKSASYTFRRSDR